MNSTSVKRLIEVMMYKGYKDHPSGIMFCHYSLTNKNNAFYNNLIDVINHSNSLSMYDEIYNFVKEEENNEKYKENIHIYRKSIEYKIFLVIKSLQKLSKIDPVDDIKELIRKIKDKIISINFSMKNNGMYLNRYHFYDYIEKMRERNSDKQEDLLLKIILYTENVVFVDFNDEVISSIILYHKRFKLSPNLKRYIIEKFYNEDLYSEREIDEDILSVSLLPHQKDIVYRWKNMWWKENGKTDSKYLALFCEPRTGKSFPTLQIMIEEMNKNGYQKAIVICPKSISRFVWERYINEYVSDKDVVCIVIDEIDMDSRFKLLESISLSKIDKGKKVIVISTYDTFSRFKRRFVDEYHKKNGGFDYDIVVLDESHKIKSRDTNVYHNIMKLLYNAKVKLILTGTPYGNNYDEVYNQLRFLTNYPLMCNNLSQFIAYFCVRDSFYGKYRLVRKTEFLSELSKIAETKTQQDVGITMPTITYYPIQPSNKIMEIYNKTLLSYQTQLETMNEPLTIKGILSMMAKLIQISNGFLYTEESIHFIENTPKDEYVSGLIEENIGTTPVIVSVLFRAEYEKWRKIAENLGIECEFIYGGLSDDERTKILNRFNNGDFRLLFVNPKVAGLGLNLSVSNMMIYQSYSWSLIEARQMRDRILDVNKETPTNIIFPYHINTLESVIIERLKGKDVSLKEILESGNVGELIKIFSGELNGNGNSRK